MSFDKDGFIAFQKKMGRIVEKDPDGIYEPLDEHLKKYRKTLGNSTNRINWKKKYHEQHDEILDIILTSLNRNRPRDISTKEKRYRLSGYQQAISIIEQLKG